MSANTIPLPITRAPLWSAVGSMGLCVAMLIASEFMPVSLLTPMAKDLGATQGMAGQAISISGIFAVAASLFIATIAGQLDTWRADQTRCHLGGGRIEERRYRT